MTPLSEVRATLEESLEAILSSNMISGLATSWADGGESNLVKKIKTALTHLAEVEAEYAACQKTTDEIALAHKKGLVHPLEAELSRLKADYDALLDHNGSQEQEIERLRAENAILRNAGAPDLIKEMAELRAEVDRLTKIRDAYRQTHELDEKDSEYLQAENTRLREALTELIEEVRDMATVFEEYGMDTTATACLFEAEAAESALQSPGEGRF